MLRQQVTSGWLSSGNVRGRHASGNGNESGRGRDRGHASVRAPVVVAVAKGTVMATLDLG